MLSFLVRGFKNSQRNFYIPLYKQKLKKSVFSIIYSSGNFDPKIVNELIFRIKLWDRNASQTFCFFRSRQLRVLFFPNDSGQKIWTNQV